MTKNLKTENLAAFVVVGIEVKTANAPGKAEKDIPALWEAFMKQEIMSKIQSKISADIYCIYTHYEGDYTQPYTTFLGCRVSTLESIPEGLSVLTINAGHYFKKEVKGDLTQGVVFGAWQEIWQMPLDRAYTADFEVYGQKASLPNQAEVDIYVALK